MAEKADEEQKQKLLKKQRQEEQQKISAALPSVIFDTNNATQQQMIASSSSSPSSKDEGTQIVIQSPPKDLYKTEQTDNLLIESEPVCMYRVLASLYAHNRMFV